MVENFIEKGGYISTLLIDRGYLDGEMLTDFKRKYKIKEYFIKTPEEDEKKLLYKILTTLENIEKNSRN